MPGGSLRLVRWGNRRHEDRRLPYTGGASLKTSEQGGWEPFKPIEVDIPATVCLDGDVWFAVRQGIRGIVVRDEHHGRPAAGKAQVMPIFSGERF
jgi:hypothetical protein